jgi:hypothetical protein
MYIVALLQGSPTIIDATDMDFKVKHADQYMSYAQFEVYEKEQGTDAALFT